MKKKNSFFGISLIFVGLFGYFGYEFLGATKTSLTALIPALIGIVIYSSNFFSSSTRKHITHLALLFSFIGIIASASRIFKAETFSGSTILLSLTFILCLGFIIGGVQSFKEAKKKKREGI